MKIYKVGEKSFVTKAEAARHIGIPRTTFLSRLEKSGGSFASEMGTVREVEVDEHMQITSTSSPMPPVLQQIAERYSDEEQRLLAKGINPLAEQIHFPDACFVGKKFRFWGNV